MPTPRHSSKKNIFWRGFGATFAGLRVLAGQHNVRGHATATVLVIAAGFFFHIERWEWCVVALATALVWVAEAFNTAVEELGDAVTLEHHPLVGRAKDVASAGVLLAAIGAACAGLLVFAPHILAWWNGM